MKPYKGAQSVVPLSFRSRLKRVPPAEAFICLLLTIALLGTACTQGEPASTPTPTSTLEPDIPTLTPAPSGTTAPEITRRTVRLWLVEPLAPEGKVPSVLLDQIESFRADRSNVDTEVRVKEAGGVSDVLEVLRSTASVAPAALPDLVLLDRADLLSAQADALIQSLADRVPQEILDDLFPVARALATSGEVLYGVPYVLDMQHLVYREPAFEAPPATFDDLLSGPAPYLFPAAAGESLIGQYLAGGGALVDADGNATLDEDVALDVLRFYQEAVESQLIQSTLLEYSAPSDYLDSFIGGQANVANITASAYLAHRAELDDVAAAPVPAHGGPSTAVVTGWAWALAAAEPEQQTLALDLLSWLMRPEHQGAFTREAGRLPSQRAALRIWGDDSYLDFIAAYLEDAVPAPGGGPRTMAVRALQEAVRSVLLQRSTAKEAAGEALQAVMGDE